MVRALQSWNHDNAEHFNVYLWPWRWEENSYATYGREGQSELNHQLVRRADLAVAFLRDKLGTTTGRYESGTVEEIEECRKRGLSPAVHFLTGAEASPTGEEAERLAAYRKQLEKKRFYYKPFTSTADGVRQAMSSVAARVYELSQEEVWSGAVAQGAAEGLQQVPEPVQESRADASTGTRPSVLGGDYPQSFLRDRQRGTRRMIGELVGMQGLVQYDWKAEISDFGSGWEIRNTSGMPLELRRFLISEPGTGSQRDEIWTKGVPARTVQPRERVVIEDPYCCNPQDLMQAKVRVEYVAEGVFLEGVLAVERDSDGADEEA